MSPLNKKISTVSTDRFSVSCYCPRCGRDQNVDLALYPDYTFEDISRKIKCPTCGETGLRFSIRPVD